VNLDEIITYVDTVIPGVGTRTPTGNSIPTVEAGVNYTIPTQTPFTVTAVGSDANSGDTLTYDWEERDLGPQRDLAAADNGSSPLFRSFLPTTSPSRTFPQLSDILSNTPNIDEKLPTVARTMHLRATVRDNRTGGGGFSSDEMTINVVNTGAAFAITGPNTAVNWSSSTTQTVTWNVAGTTGNGINTSLVNILLSTDGGNTFPITLAANTPNDGSQAIVVPNAVTSKARIKVQAVGNIFFDISNANFTISVAPGVDLVGSSFTATPTNLRNSGGFVDTSTVIANQGSTASGAFDVKFYLSDDATINPANDVLLTLDPSSPFYNAAEPSAYHVTGSIAGFGTRSANVRLVVPVNDPFRTDNQYFIGMYVDADSNVTETNETNNVNLGVGIDQQPVTYALTFANSTAITIPDSGVGSLYPSTINVSGLSGKIGDVNVSLLGLTHTFPDDLDLLLVGPTGQKMILMSDVGGGNAINGINLVLDDQGASALSNTGQLVSGTFRPTNIGTGDTFPAPAPASPYDATLGIFNASNPNGTWSLYVLDDQSANSGSLANGWSLTFVVANASPTDPVNVLQPAINEDVDTGSNLGRLVSTIVQGSGSTDADGDTLGIAVTTVDNTHGQWQYTTDPGSGWQDISSASATTARLLGPSYYVRFNPNADFNSFVGAAPTFGFKTWDQTAGTAGGTADTTTSNAFSAAAAIAKTPVTQLNDAPIFTIPSVPVIVTEDDGPIVVNGFATGIGPGPATATDEAGQTVTFFVTVSGTTGGLTFSAAPSIDPVTGALSFTTAPDANGTATIDVLLQDNGSSTPPNVNISALQEFTITVGAVNDEQEIVVNSVRTVDRGSSISINNDYLITYDADDPPADLIYTVTSGPSHGTLLVGGVPVTQFSQEQLNHALLVYQNDGSANSTDSFGFTVDDGKGTASTGTFNLAIRQSSGNSGDFDRDLVVDAGDYVLWRKTAGATNVPAYSGADGNGDTTIDQADYTVWQSQFGNTTGVGGGASVEGMGSAEGGVRSGEGLADEVSLAKSVVLVEQPPALPGVPAALPFSYALQASELRMVARGHLYLMPEAEPRAVVSAEREDALLEWLRSNNAGSKSDPGEMNDLFADCPAGAGEAGDLWDAIDVAFEDAVSRQSVGSI
jgi:subtilisin-like proprotein convertase family protein